MWRPLGSDPALGPATPSLQVPFVPTDVEGDGFEEYWAALKQVVCTTRRPALTAGRITPEMGKLMHACWALDPLKRPPIGDVIKAIDAMKPDYLSPS